MRQFYETWCEDLKSLTTVSGLGDDKSLTAVSEIDTQLLIPCESPHKENFDVASFLRLGFTHHMIIVRKTKSLAERLFYIRQALANKWSKEVLSARTKKTVPERFQIVAITLERAYQGSMSLVRPFI